MEAAAIIAQRTDNPREYFKQRERAVAVSFDSSPLSSHRAAAPPHPEPALPPCVDSSWDKPEQSVAPQMHEEEPLISDFREMPPIPEPVPPPQDPTGSLLDLWDSPAPQCAPEQLPLLVEAPPQDPSSPAAPLPLHSEPPVAEGTLLSFDDLPEPPATFCEAEEGGDNPPSLVDIGGQHQMTLGYQHALQEASGSDSQDKEELLMTNGETLQKEGTQRAAQEIDITCWDTDPVTEEDEYGAEE
ncbi:UNVERIFIED_CONTAM: hypothetical protein FKN15_070909 [Acipenser sinensis]